MRHGWGRGARQSGGVRCGCRMESYRGEESLRRDEVGGRRDKELVRGSNEVMGFRRWKSIASYKLQQASSVRIRFKKEVILGLWEGVGLRDMRKVGSRRLSERCSSRRGPPRQKGSFRDHAAYLLPFVSKIASVTVLNLLFGPTGAETLLPHWSTRMLHYL